MAGRTKRQLGDRFGLQRIGINLTTLAPGAVSALHHVHSRQEEFVYVLQGRPTLFLDALETELSPGMCVGFAPGGPAHHLENRTDAPVAYLEIGDRVAGDEASYPVDDLMARHGPSGWIFTRKDGSPW
ncbi:MAG: cupin domain-containing protein [Brevundimonas sp.]